jgi:hypothetical protein
MEGKMRRFILTALVLTILGSLIPISAQFTRNELAERSQWEDFLKSAKIIHAEQPWSRAEAVTSPWLLTLEKDGVTKKAIWKNVSGRLKGFSENWRWEVAAYRLDKYLGLNMVPPTVEKRFQGERGSCQLFIEDCQSLKKIYKENTPIPIYRSTGWQRALYLRRAFDNLIANDDRHQNQYLVTKDFRIILIDHSRTFGTSKKYTRDLIYDEDYREGPRCMEQLPLHLVTKLKKLDSAELHTIAGDYLKDREIEAVLIRKDLILEWLRDRCEKLGENAVYY